MLTPLCVKKTPKFQQGVLPGKVPKSVKTSGDFLFVLRLKRRNQHWQGSSLRSHLHSGQCLNPTNSTNYYLSQ